MHVQDAAGPCASKSVMKISFQALKFPKAPPIGVAVAEKKAQEPFLYLVNQLSVEYLAFNSKEILSVKK